jgi:uroporphyrinogen decarboxylase
MKQLSRRERIQAAINRQPVDRVPYAVWRHFPAVDRSPAGLAQATLRFHDHYGSDFLKITPHGGYAVEAWGCVEAEEVLPDGHRACASCAIKAPEDWKKIRPLDPTSAEGYSQQLETIVRMGFDRRVGDAIVMPTIFSPLSLAGKLAAGRLAGDLDQHPSLVRGALEAITETLIKFIDATLSEGLTGVFYSIQAASRSVHTEETYAEFGEPYDRKILETIGPRSLLTIIHCHGDALMFDRLATLPGHAWNWDDRRTPPTLAQARAKVPGAVIGGLDQWATLRDGTPEASVAQAKDAITQTGGTGLIVGTGCVLAMNTPDENVAAVVRALGGPLKPVPGIRPAASS